MNNAIKTMLWLYLDQVSIFNKMTLSYFAQITRKLFNLSYYLSLIKDDTNIEWSERVTLNVSHFFTYSSSLNIRPLNQSCDSSSSSIFNKITLSQFAQITRKLFNLSYYLSLIYDDTNIEWSERVTINVSHCFYLQW